MSDTALRPSAWILSPVALALMVIASTTLFRAQQVLVWKFSILATEYGHWLALGAVLLLAGRVTLGLNGTVPRIEAAVLIASLLLFARPAVEAGLNERRWVGDLNAVFQAPMDRPLLSFRQLWWAPRRVPIMPEKITYAKYSTGDLSLYLYRAATGKPAPFIVVVHGGGWDNGNALEFADMNEHLVRLGYAVIAVDYRLVPAAQWPAPREDVHAAVAYAKAHAKQWNLDPDRWAILGRSAGGQIAQAVAYQAIDPSLKGLIAYYSPADLEFAYTHSEEKDIINSRDLLRRLLGGDLEKVPAAYNDSSPIRFAGAGSPPTLLLHGLRDPLTWNVQSRRLHDKLAAAGARAVYLELPWATHAFDFNLNGPGGQVATSAVELFLAAIFNGGKHV